MAAYWDWSALDKRIKARCETADYRKAISPLNSIQQNQMYCRYHYKEYKRLNQEHLEAFKNEGLGARGLVNRVLIPDEKEQFFKVACEAHINAFLRNLHSGTDLLAHVVYFCLDFDHDNELKLNQRSISLSTLVKKLVDSKKYSSLKNLLIKYTDSEDYKYFFAWGNHTKHWSNITCQLTYNLKEVDSGIYSWDFEPFVYSGNSYPKMEVMKFIEREYDRQSELLPKIIKEVDLLNAQFIGLEL
ncbi:hypothetical protein [Marinomonas lutimaris]|uniref:hypothetical protein n=1 Tax=Marinomonas lutimaris TaxID=2846746 RepID=UPI001CA55FF1|nr:hypothetical protein [Marinomonas lutimaris]